MSVSCDGIAVYSKILRKDNTIGRVLNNASATHAFGIPGGEVLVFIHGLKCCGI
jgi:hypothetical protein